jgi:acyl-CoA synthetase (AMP-forming)/AMP-acid ligase II
VTVSAYAVTIRIPRSWQRTPGLGSGLGYSGASGWVQLQPLTERAGLHAACAEVAANKVSQYGRHPFIGYLRIDGRPGCQIPAALVNAGTAIPLATALVEYRSPISGGANFLLMTGDPATILRTGQVATENDLIAFSRAGLPSFKRPRRVVFVDGHPTTGTGKIRRVELREMATAV